MKINNVKSYIIDVADVTAKNGKTYKAVLIDGNVVTFDRLIIWKLEHYVNEKQNH